jgi:trehalose/maltose hydrolase-like predicted phosphorylase
LRDDQILNQFEGFDQLKEFDWVHYREKYGDIQRLDRILKSENDSTNRYKVTKQADVLMIFYLFSAEEIRDVFEELGYPFEPEMIPGNIHYYQQHTSHGSTLSRLVYSWVLSRSDRKSSWNLFKEALRSDYKDIQGGTTPEGIHLGAMAGTVDMMQRCYLGMEMRDDVLFLNPQIPINIKNMRLRIRYRGDWIKIETSPEKFTVQLEKGWSGQVDISIRDERYTFKQGEVREFALKTSI